MWLAHDRWETVESFISCIGRDSTPSFAKILCFTYLLLARIIDICKGINILPFISSLMSKILLWCCYYYFSHISQEVCGRNSIRPGDISPYPRPLNSLPWPPARSAWWFHCLCRARTFPSPQLPKDLNYGTRAGVWPILAQALSKSYTKERELRSFSSCPGGHLSASFASTDLESCLHGTMLFYIRA